MQKRILAIDDEPHMLILLERIIGEKTPHYLKTTSNALEVPEILNDEHFDLIITDLKMPKLDGLDVVKLIRESHRTEAIVIITAFGTDETARHAKELGVDSFITKPFRKEDILDCIEAIFQRQEDSIG